MNQHNVVLVIFGGLLFCCASSAVADSSLRADCSLAGSEALPGGVCVRLFDLPGRDSEASVAAHPNDPRTLVVSWQGTGGSGSVKIHAAVTTDGGKHWNIRTMDPPRLDTAGVDVARAVDSTSGVAPDGTIYVSFLALTKDTALTPDYLGNPAYRLIVASSRDGGDTWSYRSAHDSAGQTLNPDFPDLAVAPDTGHLYIVAQQTGSAVQPVRPLFNCLAAVVCPPTERIAIWKSTDGGESWIGPNPVQSFLNTEYFFPRTPRIVAGREGLLVVTVKSSPYEPSALSLTRGYATISRDSGDTWSAPFLIHADAPDSTFKPVGIEESEAGQRLHAMYFDGTRVVGYRADAEGLSWEGPQAMFDFPAETAGVWLAAAMGRSGDLFAQYRYGNSMPARFSAGLTRWGAGGAVENLTLVDLPGAPGQFMSGDDYGALTIAADGSAWMAWSDPRGRADEAIALARVRVIGVRQGPLAEAKIAASSAGSLPGLVLAALGLMAFLRWRWAHGWNTRHSRDEESGGKDAPARSSRHSGRLFPKSSHSAPKKLAGSHFPEIPPEFRKDSTPPTGHHSPRQPAQEMESVMTLPHRIALHLLAACGGASPCLQSGSLHSSAAIQHGRTAV
jgi:hypothetical protein